MYRYFKVLFVGSMIFMPLSIWSEDEATAVSGSLEIAFTMDRGEPTVIWIEDGERNFIKTLFVSNWMATDGTWKAKYKNLLPEWRSKAQWLKKDPPQSFVDGVSGATPPRGRYLHVEQLEELNLAQGSYHYCVETVFEDEDLDEIYNVMYRGKIEFGGDENQSAPEPVCEPFEPIDGNYVLAEVVGKYLKK